MFDTQLFLLGLIAVGFLAAKTRMVDEHSRSSLTDLVLNIFLPCNILLSFFGSDSSGLQSMGIMAVISIGTIAISYILYRVLYFKTGPEQKKILLYAMLIPNANFLGSPLIENIYGIASLSYVAAYLMPLRIAILTVGLVVFTGGKGNLKLIIFHPCMIATYLGVAVMFSGFYPPVLAYRLISALGSSTTPVSMIVVGCILGQIKSKKFFTPLVVYFSAIRLLFIPFLIMGILFLFRTEPLITGISVILCGTPAGVTTTILADKYGADKNLASKIVFASTLLSMVTIPLLMWLL